MMAEPQSERRQGGRKPLRTCVGCGKADEAAALVRLVVGPDGEIVFDLAGHSFGRGAHLHPSLACIAKAGRGLSRTFKKPVQADPQALSRSLVEAADRRIAGLLSAAARSGAVDVGFEAADLAWKKGMLPLVVVATDAGSCASASSIRQAVAEGRAVAWGTREVLGSLVQRPDVAVLGVRGAKIAAAVLTTCRTADGARSVSEVR